MAENISFLAQMSNFWAADMVYVGLNTYLIGELLLEVNNLIKKHIGHEKGPSKRKIEFGSWIK